MFAVGFALLKAFGGVDTLIPALQRYVLENIAPGLDPGSLDAFTSLIENARAGAVGLGGVAGLLISGMATLYSIETAFLKIWKTPATKPLFYRVATYWFFITLGPCLTGWIFWTVKESLGGVGSYFGAFGFFYFLYWAIPHRNVPYHSAAASALIALFAGVMTRFIYLWYLGAFQSYNKLYGSLAAVPIVLVWMYLTWYFVLIGALVGAKIADSPRFNKKLGGKLKSAAVSLLLICIATPQAALSQTTTLCDRWYTITLEKKVRYGYYHQTTTIKDSIIEFTEDTVKREEKKMHSEKVRSTVDKLTLRPISFNYEKIAGKKQIQVQVKIQDNKAKIARSDNKVPVQEKERILPKDISLSLAFPYWIQNYFRSQSQKTGSLRVWVEDQYEETFPERDARIQKTDRESKFRVDFEGQSFEWRLDPEGCVEEIKGISQESIVKTVPADVALQFFK